MARNHQGYNLVLGRGSSAHRSHFVVLLAQVQVRGYRKNQSYIPSMPFLLNEIEKPGEKCHQCSETRQIQVFQKWGVPLPGVTDKVLQNLLAKLSLFETPATQAT